MIGPNSCSHGIPQVRKVCYSSECQHSAFVSMSCDDCQLQHDHDGRLILQNRTTLLAQLDDIPAGGTLDTEAVDSVCDAAGDAGLHINEVCADIARDFQQVCAGLILKPQIEQTIQRIQRFDHRLTGAEVYALTEAIRLKDCYSNKDAVNKKASQLDRLYTYFLQGLSTSIQRFREVKEGFLSGKKIAKEQPKVVPKQIKTPSEEIPDIVAQQKKAPQWTPSTMVNQPHPTMMSRAPRLPYNRRLDITKVQDIQAFDQKLNLHVKVVKVEFEKKGGKTFVVCLLGDETGTVQGRFDSEKEPDVRLGASLDFVDVRAHVHRRHIVIHVKHPNSIYYSSEEINEVNTVLNISNESYDDKEQDSD